jgi:magnesium-transporting ATPase (P-type)
VVELEEGTLVPADLRILESYDMRVDNYLYTGDPEP